MVKCFYIYLFFSFFLFSNAYAKTESECKEAVEKELYLRGLVNEKVCLNTTNYPDVHINTDLKNLVSGKSDGKIADEDLNAMSGLEHILSEAFKDVEGAKKEVAGYTDGEIAVFNRFDEKFFKSVKGKDPKSYQESLASNSKYQLELDKDLISNYVSSIKDPLTKNKLKEIINATSDFKVSMKKTGSGDNVQYIPEGNNELLVDLLRNHALAIDRTEQFCNKMPDPEACKKDQVGVTSIDLLTKSKSKTEPRLKDYSGKCGGRRGVAYRFIFPDSMIKNVENSNGEYKPSFNIPGREIQNNMQLAAAMDFMKKIEADKTNFPEMNSKNLKELEKTKMFTNYADDNARFSEFLKKNGSGCADSKYQVDNQRRLYWATQKEMIDAKELLKNSNDPKKSEYESMLTDLQKGDFSKLKNNSEFEDIYDMATYPEPHGTDYFGSISKKISDKYEFTSKDGSNLLKLEEEFKRNESYFNNYFAGKNYNDLNVKDKKNYDILLSDMKNQQSEIERLNAKKNNKNLYEKKKLYNSIDGQTIPANPLRMQMIALMRTLIIGRPVMHEVLVKDKKREGMDEFYRYDGTYNVEGNHKLYNRYSSNGEFTKTSDIGFAQADVHSCHDISDALVDHMKSNPDVLKSDLGRTGEEGADANVLDEVSFGIDGIKPIDIGNSKAGWLYNEEKLYQFQTLENQGYLAKGSVKENKISTLGWVCQECGSGIHVHPDGSVHPVSRQRVNGNYAVSKDANMSFDVSKGDNFSLGGMQHLKVYELKKCKDCSCVSGFKNGNDFKNYLSSNGQVHNMITYDSNNKPVIDPEKNKFDVKDPNICLYVAPVPHSCNFDPIGESKEKQKNKEVRESLYCKLETFMKNDTNFNTKYPPLSNKKESKDYQLGLEPNKTMNLCNKSKFPQSEEDCFNETKEVSSDLKDELKTKSN